MIKLVGNVGLSEVLGNAAKECSYVGKPVKNGREYIDHSLF